MKKCCNNCTKYSDNERECYLLDDVINEDISPFLYCDHFKPRQERSCDTCCNNDAQFPDISCNVSECEGYSHWTPHETWSEDGKSCDVWVDPERIEPLTTYDVTRGVDKVIGRLYAKQCELIHAVNKLKERDYGQHGK